MDFSVEVKQHAQFQIEMKLICPFDEKKKVNDSHIDVFFFLPRNLAVNEKTYQTSDFYKDFSEYVRFKTPSLRLMDLTAADNAVLQRLSDSIQHLPESEDDFCRHLKMYCSIVKSSLRDTEQALEALSPAQQPEALSSYIDNIRKVLETYRALRPEKWASPKAEELYWLVDEFLSVTSNGYLFRFWNAVPDQAITKAVAGATEKEILYREKQGYPSAESEDAELLYRESTLKKAMAGILFLRTSMRKDGVFLENLLLGLCAAVAMIFVTGISFLWKGLFLEEFSASFFIVWVIAYMFKDRIKSQLQLFRMNSRSQYSYDYRQQIFDAFDREIGVCREGFRYCRTKDVGEKVIQVRNRTSLSRLENGSLDENVILYRKKIELFGAAAYGIIKEFKVHGVVNIYRLNLLHWTYKMDNPTRTIYSSNGKEILPIEARRDYHINMVLRYGEENGEEHYARYRVVLCRNGIRRIDRF